jgi:hypothetical protein
VPIITVLVQAALVILVDQHQVATHKAVTLLTITKVTLPQEQAALEAISKVTGDLTEKQEL